MSLFGNWTCPNCGSAWDGSIGWDMTLLITSNKDKLNCLLQTLCGCGPIDDPIYPTLSCSFMNFVESDKRKRLCSESSDDKNQLENN